MSSEGEENGKEYWRLRTEALQADYQMRELLRDEFKKALRDHERQCPAMHRNATLDRVITGVITGVTVAVLVALIVNQIPG